MSAADGNGSGNVLRERPVGELMKQLSDETTMLVHQELELAKAELGQKAKEAGAGAGMLGGAGIAGLLTLGALTAALIAGLDTAMATWLACLIAGVLWGAIAAVMALTGKGRLQHAAPPVPEQTKESVKEDVAWAKTRARSASR